MAGNKNTKYDGMSASKAKRERAKDEREQVKRAATRNKAIGIGIIVLIAGRTRLWLPLITALC